MLTGVSRVCKTGISLAIILSAALFLRLYHVKTYDLWFDELGTEMYSSQSMARQTGLSGMEKVSLALSWLKRDPHSPVYYALIFLSSMVTGDGTNLRFLSVLFSMLALVMFYKVSRLFFDDRVSLTALAIMAFNPLHLWYAQEARVYAMATFFLLAAFYAFMRGVMTGRTKYWALFVLTGVLSIFSIYNSAVFFVLTGIVFFTKDYRKHFRQWLASLLSIFAVCLFAWGIFLPQADFVRNDFWIKPPSWRTLLYTWHFFILGYSATPALYMAALAPFVGLSAYGAYLFYRTDKLKAVMIFLLFTLPLAAVFIFSKIFFPIYLHRQVIIYSPTIYLFIACGLQGLRSTLIRRAMAVFIAGMMLVSVVRYYHGHLLYDGEKIELTGSVPPKKNYKATFQKMFDRFQEGDLIVVADPLAYAVARSFVTKHFDGSDRPSLRAFKFLIFPEKLFPYDQRYLGIKDVIAGLTAQEQGELYELTVASGGQTGLVKSQIVQDGPRRIWVVSSSWLDSIPGEPNYLRLRSYLREFYESKIYDLRSGIQIEVLTWKIQST